MIDYIQLLQGSTSRASENRVQEVTEITTGLKALAKELNVPIVALSQLSRQVEVPRRQAAAAFRSARIRLDRAGRRRRAVRVPRRILPEDKQAATEAPQNIDEWLAEWKRVDGKAEVIIGKQRHGPTGTVELQFDAEVTRFADLDTRHQPEF